MLRDHNKILLNCKTLETVVDRGNIVAIASCIVLQTLVPLPTSILEDQYGGPEWPIEKCGSFQ